MSDQVTITMTKDELALLIRGAVRAEFDRIGLSVEDAENVYEAREDFRFTRKLRVAIDRASGWIGKTILTALVAGIFALIAKGVNISLK